MQNVEWSKKEASKIINMRMPGVEPGSQAWEACMMPLHYMRSASLESYVHTM